MAPSIVKELGNKTRRRILLNSKRKRAKYPHGAARAVLLAYKSSNKMVGKRSRLNSCRGKYMRCENGFYNSIASRYSNFMKSGMPQRLMFYQAGKWIDYPKGLIGMVKKDLQMKKATIEVNLDGDRLLLDFLHMFELNLETGLQHHIAWIDEADSCFFPEIFVDESCERGCRSCMEPNSQVFSGSHEVKLHLEVDLNGVNPPKLKEYSGESNFMEDHLQFGQDLAKEHLLLGVENSCNKEQYMKMTELVGINQEKAASLVSRNQLVGENLDVDEVRRIFLVGTRPFGSLEIMDVYHCSSPSMEARFELFLKQAEITKNSRGDANVRHAWLAAPKAILHTLTNYGLGNCGSSIIKTTYGIGVHLAPAHHLNIRSAYRSDIDENSIGHILLCRVIMGNMEQVDAGSRQFHPRSEDVDSGVDNLQSPTQYIIWNMNMNTHIYPEFVLSFKIQTNNQGIIFGNESNCANSMICLSSQGHMASQSLMVDLERQAHSNSGFGEFQAKISNSGPNAHRIPKSPWMLVPTLFAAISDKVSPRNMAIIYSLFDQYKAKKISRDDFVQKLRFVVGDNILRSTIMGLQSQVSLKHQVAPFERKGECSSGS